MIRSTYPARAASAALLFACTIAYAQTPQAPAVPPAKMTTPNTSGNDLLNGTKPPTQDNLATPRSAGQDKADGNDMVSGDNRTDKETGKHPEWKTMDSQKSGYLTAKDVKKHKWLSKNFARCNTSHDGHLTEAEYAACTGG
jgi:hypothetical protein